MNRYIFALSQKLRAEFRFSVMGETVAEAVRVANDELNANDFRIWGAAENLADSPRAEWMAQLNGGIDETMLVGEDAPPLADDLRQAGRTLEAAGYGYAWSGDGNLEESLARDDEPLFTKPVWTEDESGVDAYLQVRARYEDDEVGYGFRIEAMLYPTGRGELERGEAPFRVRLEDKQYLIGAEELPLAIEVYEKKFLELIKLIRKNNLAADTGG